MAEITGNGPIPAEVERITNLIIADLGNVDLESCLTVIVNLAGQLVAALSEGKPSAIQAHGNSLAESIKKAAIAKLLYDDDQRRAAEREAEQATVQ